jgi:hypothetical protein
MSEKMKILIAYDGSDCANAALEDLQRAGLPHVAEALIMSVADVFLPPSSSPAPGRVAIWHSSSHTGGAPAGVGDSHARGRGQPRYGARLIRRRHA